jgi:hypothetical protein
MIFAKNQELILLELKGKLTPVPMKSVGAYAKSIKCLCNEIRADMYILSCLLFMWGVVPSFPFAVSVAAS